MKEFRLVLYMNGTDAIHFWGGRAAASPIAYYFHLQKQAKNKVFLGGSFRFTGLGKYKTPLNDALHRTSKPIYLPHVIPRNNITISDKAYIYQNNDPLFSQADHEVYWEATIDRIGRDKWFGRKQQEEYTLGAVRIGTGGGETNDDWRALVSTLVRLRKPVEKRTCPWKVYRGDWEERPFWGDNKMPLIPRKNAFVHATPAAWERFDALAKSNTLSVTQVSDTLIRHNRIRESLVHGILKMMFAREGWWVNFEVPISDGRIDFLVKQSSSRQHPWRVIEVKVEDNPDAVQRLHDYIEAIMRNVRWRKSNSLFWPLWDGRGSTKPRGVVLCAAPGKETRKEVRDCKYDYDVWTYEYSCDNNTLGMVIRDAATDRLILKTR